MPIKILMPALSPTMTEGNLVKWNKQEGDKVHPGQILAEIETDKATMEVEAVDEGILGKILVPGGTKAVKVNTLLALLLEEGEDLSALNIEQQSVEPDLKIDLPNKAIAAPTEQTQQIAKIESIQNGRVLASPFAKKLASENNLNLANIQGSGPQGRVVKKDILASTSLSEQMTSSGIRRVTPEQFTLPLSSMREIIAKRLVESKQQIPHFYLSVDCNMGKLLETRNEINTATDSAKPLWKISVNDLVIKAVGLALSKIPEASAAWVDNSIVQYNNVDISVAVAIKNGLITPIIRNADQKSIFVISKEMKELAHKARQNLLKPSEFQGGSATISNLGMYGIRQFSAIINPPQSCIFAIGAAYEAPAVVQGKIEVTHTMNITLSCDHRVVDGAIGANLLQSLKEYLENPSRLLI